MKAKKDLTVTEIPEESRQKVQTLQENYDDIVNKYSIDIGLTYLEEMTVDTDSNFASCHEQTISITFKNHKFIK